MKIFDFHCNACKQTFEKFVNFDEPQDKVLCPSCGTYAFRRPVSPKLSYRMMGTDSRGNPTAADKWAKMHEDGAKAEESPNIVHI